MLKRNDKFGLAIPKMKGNTLFYLSNGFLEALLKSKISWQWQLHHGKYYRNHCFILFENLPINIA